MPRLIVLIEFERGARRGHTGGSRRGERKSVGRIQPHCRSIRPEQKIGLAGGGLAAAKTSLRALHAALQAVALELGVASMEYDPLRPAVHIELYLVIEHQLSFFRIKHGPDRTSVSLGDGE